MSLARDVPFAVRLLRRNHAFAIAALTVVALGVGATTAVVTVVRAVLLQPLPYKNPNDLVVLRADSGRGARQAGLTGQELVALRDRTDIFAALATIIGVDANLTGVDDMEALPAASISDDFFRVIGVAPFAGRPLSLSEDMGRERVSGIAISYELWQRRWHGDPTLVGRQIEVNNFRATVVAIMPSGFEIYLGPGIAVPRHIDVFFPYDITESGPTTPNYPAIGRLHRGTTLRSAQHALDAFSAPFVADHPADYKTGAVRLTAVHLADDVVHDVRPALLALAGAVGFVLLVACANLTNLLLARACMRTRELSVRIAIGASRWQLIRQLAVESLVLAALGGLGGMLVASWGISGLMQLAPANLPRRESIGIGVDVVVIALAAAFLSSLVFGLVPAWQATRPDVAGSLKGDPASRSSVTRGALVASQLALSLVLLVGAGLLLRTFVAMRQTSLGYQPAHLVSMRIQLVFAKFREPADRLAFYDRAAAAVRALPGVDAVAFGTPSPLDGLATYRRVARGPETPEIATYQPTVLPGYFQTLGIRMREGRDFTIEDKTTPDRTPIIVDHTLARQLFPGERAVGRRVLLFPHANTEQWAEIVGVVDHARVQDVRSDGLPQLYVTFDHRPMFDTRVLVRTQTDPHALAGPIGQTIERLGPGRPVARVRVLQDLVDDGRADTRFALVVLGAFAAIALVLTAVGVYGVVAYSTARRTREIAVRRALGADARQIVALVVREGTLWTCAGLAAGIAGAFLLSRYLSSLVVEVGVHDPLTFIAVAGLLGAIALVATVLPALRAVRVDSMLALRAD